MNAEGEMDNEDLDNLKEKISELREMPAMPVPPGAPATGAEVMVIEEGDTGTTSKRKLVSVRIVKITDLTTREAERVRHVAGESDEALTLDQISFYPNPGNGRFWMEFATREAKETEIRIINSAGSLVYAEVLQGFTGSYKKEIDLGSRAPGLYFVRISQGGHAVTKKLIVE